MHIAVALTNLLYPPACLLCRAALPPSLRGDRPLCNNCAEDMPRCGPPVCLRCGVDLPGAFDAVVECSACRRIPQAFEMARAPWRYRGPVEQAIRQFKYHRQWRIGRWLAEDMATTARRSLPLHEVDAVVPVPLHWLKRRLRGFAPTEDLAEAVSGLLGKPYLPTALRRTRWTGTQTRLRWQERFRNVREAFTARNRDVRERVVLLIDDVLTSGATVNACARALKEAGARRVFVLTAARTPLA